MQLSPFILRPIQKEDSQAIFDYLSPRVAAPTRLSVPHCPAEAEQWIRKASSSLDKYVFSIREKEQGFVGVISLTQVGGLGHFYFWLGEPFWGRGIATAVSKCLLEWAFDKLGLTALFTCVQRDNGPSLRIMEKLQMNRLPVNHEEYDFFCTATKGELATHERLLELKWLLKTIRSDLVIP